MAFSTNLLAIVAASAVLLVVACHGSPVEVQQEEYFTEIGTINGKTYLTPKNDTKVSWFGAREMCAFYNLQLASFRDYEEFQFVRSNVEYTTKLWVGARIPGQDTSGSNMAFKWLDGSDFDFENINFIHQFAHWICVIFNADDHMYTESCNTGMYNYLCETTS